MWRVVMAAVLLVSCSKKSASLEACKVTSDCQAGLFCVADVCRANVGSGLGCSSPTDCRSSEACVGGKCGQFGCDSSHNCNDSCCDAGQCVASDACAGGLTCGSTGVCPARCDAASGGNGCNSGCCDSTSGACGDGTANNACGASGACSSCGAGTTCSSQTCTCSSCSGSTVCAGGGCAECSATPCAGNTPFCDAASTHACQPCSDPNAPSNVCSGATPFCNFTAGPNAGACSATPDSSQACALFDVANPVLISAGVCGCAEQTICPNNFLCDATSSTCFIACDPDTSSECVSGDYCVGGAMCSPMLGNRHRLSGQRRLYERVLRLRRSGLLDPRLHHRLPRLHLRRCGERCMRRRQRHRAHANFQLQHERVPGRRKLRLRRRRLSREHRPNLRGGKRLRDGIL